MTAETPSKHASSARKGKAVEHLVAAICVLATRGELNALTALVDDEGVDLGFKRRNGTMTLDVQVKARFTDEDGSRALREKARFSADVREETFRPRADLFMMYLVVSAERAGIEMAWLVPSEVLAEEGITVRPNGKPQVRFVASSKPDSDDKWRRYRLCREELPAALLSVVEALEPAISDEEAAVVRFKGKVDAGERQPLSARESDGQRRTTSATASQRSWMLTGTRPRRSPPTLATLTAGCSP